MQGLRCVSCLAWADKIKKAVGSEKEIPKASGALGDKEEDALRLLTQIFMAWHWAHPSVEIRVRPTVDDLG